MSRERQEPCRNTILRLRILDPHRTSSTSICTRPYFHRSRSCIATYTAILCVSPARRFAKLHQHYLKQKGLEKIMCALQQAPSVPLRSCSKFTIADGYILVDLLYNIYASLVSSRYVGTLHHQCMFPRSRPTNSYFRSLQLARMASYQGVYRQQNHQSVGSEQK